MQLPASGSLRQRPETISLKQARKLNLIKQDLVRKSSGRPDRSAVLKVLRDIRYLQIDPTNIVCKSHLLVLWSRLGNYDTRILDKLLFEERALFEYWVHGASIALSEDYPLCKLGMKTIVSSITPYQKRSEDWLKTNKKLADYVKSEIRSRGPLTSSEFEDKSDSGWRSSGWSNERNVGKMLEILHKRGEIIVHSRSNGGHKRWDLTERYSKSFPQEKYSDYEIIRKGLELSIRAMGVATMLQMRDYFQPGREEKHEITKIISDMVSEEVIFPIEIENISSNRTGTWYIHSKDMKLLDNLDRFWRPKTALLSPFDNLIYDRVRTRLLYGFKVIFEAYVPKEKRIFGYYVLPILHGDRLIGRIDPEMDRKNRILHLNSIYLEKGVETDEIVDSVASSIKELAEFLGAREIKLNNGISAEWKERFALI